MLHQPEQVTVGRLAESISDVMLPAAPFLKPATFAEGQAPNVWKRPQPALQPPSSTLQGLHDNMTSTPSEQQLDVSGTNLASSLWNFTRKPPTSTVFAVLWHAYLGY